MKTCWSARSLFRFAVVVELILGTMRQNTWAEDAKNSDRSPKLPTGIYAVLKSSDTADEIQISGKNQRIVKDNREKGWGDTRSQRNFLLLRTKPDVPLRLAADPMVVRDKENGNRIQVKLVDRSGKRFSRFTKENLGGRAAVVIDGKVVFIATIRSPIKNSEFEISFCANGNAERLANELTRSRAGDASKN